MSEARMWELFPPKIRLTGRPQPGAEAAANLAKDFERFRDGLPSGLESYILETYGINLAGVYGGHAIKNPFGKASGQLSLVRHQVEKDAEAGLGFVILKTLIAQDSTGEQSMHEWAIPETRMLVEKVRGRSGTDGWTVTWKGRGWFDTFQAYLDFFDQSLKIGGPAQMLIVPSVKYHLPTPEEDFWKEEEYDFTTQALVEVWDRHEPKKLMPMEKDFSPTLAGSQRATVQAKILEWLARVPGLIHRAAPGKVTMGLKMFNTLFEDEFQLRMLDRVHSASGEDRPDFLIYANRLFDPKKPFEDTVGVAYGGPDLSERNLAALEKFLCLLADGKSGRQLIPISTSATGDIHSGRIAAEYLLRGSSSFQIHTLFQLPDSEFAMRTGSKTEKSLHRLLFDPEEGFLAWLLDLRARLGLPEEAGVAETAAWCVANWKNVQGSLQK
ncbi:MAG: hypothetical protein O6850_06725 [Acidobacteria bacterium]|nr:hypothetical protein [Acidobacteriota bacterium]